MSSPSETIGLRARSFARRLGNKWPKRQGSMSSSTYDDAGGRRSHSADTGLAFTDDETTVPGETTKCLLCGAITVVGSVNMDYIALVPAHAQKNRHVHVGGENSLTMLGGHGLNQAIACVRMSHYKPEERVHGDSSKPPSSSSSLSPPKTHHIRDGLSADIPSTTPLPLQLVPHDIDVSVKLVGMVGKFDAPLIKTELRNHGIDITHLQITDEKTGAAHISVDPFGDSITKSHAYANDQLHPEHIPPLEDHLTNRRPDLLLVQLEIPVDTVQHAIKLAREADPPIPVILNPAPDNGPVPEDLWAVDHLIMNAGRADELCRGSAFYSLRGGAPPGGVRKRSNLTGRPLIATATTTVTSSSVRKPEDYWEDASYFHDLGARCVIITMGQNGAIGSARERHRKNRRRRFDSGALVASTPGSAVKDTTGASDAFIGAYAVEVLRQMKAGEEEDISRAMEMGIKAGGLAVRDVGSMSSIPWRAEVLGTEFDGVDEPGD